MSHAVFRHHFGPICHSTIPPHSVWWNGKVGILADGWRSISSPVIEPRSLAERPCVNDQNCKEITNLLCLVADLEKRATQRGGTINESYLKGIAKGLVLAHLMNHDQVQMMTRWVKSSLPSLLRTSALGHGFVTRDHPGRGF